MLIVDFRKHLFWNSVFGITQWLYSSHIEISWVDIRLESLPKLRVVELYVMHK